MALCLCVVYVHVCAELWRPELDTGCPALIAPQLWFFSLEVNLMLRITPAFSYAEPSFFFFLWVLGVQTQALTLIWQVFD